MIEWRGQKIVIEMEKFEAERRRRTRQKKKKGENPGAPGSEGLQPAAGRTSIAAALAGSAC